MNEIEQAAKEQKDSLIFKAGLELTSAERFARTCDEDNKVYADLKLARARLRYDRLLRDEGRHQIGVLNGVYAFLLELSERGCEWPDAADTCKELIKQLSGPTAKEGEGR